MGIEELSLGRGRKVGHLFQGRYKAIICAREKYLMALIRYIHLNPVRANLATRPERYQYSGHNSYMTNGTAKIVEVTPILKMLGGKKGYERFVLEGMGENHNESYYAVADQRFLGEEGFGEEIGRDGGQNDERKAKKPIETAFKEVARRVATTGAGIYRQSEPRRSRYWCGTMATRPACIIFVALARLDDRRDDAGKMKLPMLPIDIL